MHVGVRGRGFCILHAWFHTCGMSPPWRGLGALLPPSVVTPSRGASKAGSSPSSGCPPPGSCRGPPSMCCGHGCAGMGPSTVPVACLPFEGRLVSGAVPPPAAGPQGQAAGVSRPVCPGCGWCGRGGPAPAPREGRRRSGAPPPRLPALRAGCRGPPTTCCGCGCAGVGVLHCPLGLHALWGLRAAGVVGGRPQEGWPATVVRGVWRQAPSLPRLPALSGRQPGFREPYAPSVVGAGAGTQHLLRPLPAAHPPGGLSGSTTHVL